MSTHRTHRDRLPVALLGATGSVGQRFVSLLADHPWFELVALGASERNVGRAYGEAVSWMLADPLPGAIASLPLRSCQEPLGPRLVFSALDGDVAGPIETRHAEAGALVVTNARSHRLEAHVPLLVPEVNAEHLALLSNQSFGKGGIVANPNCSTIGLALALAPLQRAFGVSRVHVVTLQALSGAGLPGVPSFELLDNLIPFIAGEEDKLAVETRKIFGTLVAGGVRPAEIVVSPQCNRVAVLDGHTECVGLSLERPATREEILSAWESFRGEPQERALPSAPARPTCYLADPTAPQPRKHRDLQRGMACTIGRLQECPVLGWKFVCLSHNTLRGAAGGAVLCAELCLARGLLEG